MILKIDRRKWLHGEGSGGSALLRESDGKMCCLGFLARQLGARRKDIVGIQTPCKLYNNGHEQLKRLVKDASTEVHTKVGDKLMEYNDDENILDNRREKRLTTRFKRIGIEVRFTHKYPKAAAGE